MLDRGTGKDELTQSRHGAVALLNDLHKGRGRGAVWSWFIDASAIVMKLVSVTGLLLLFYLRRRLVTDFCVTLLGTVATVLFYWFGVR